MEGILEFLKSAERLHFEKRTVRMSNGENLSVSSHSWMMSIMAMIFAPKLKTPVDMERVLRLSAAHDLAEAKTRDIPMHELFNSAEKQDEKHRAEERAMDEFAELVGSREFPDLWREYEDQSTAEAKFVRMLDKLDVCVQVLFSKTIGYISEYDGGIYWKIYFSESYRDQFAIEPELLKFFDEIQTRIKARIKNENIKLEFEP